MTPKEGSVTPSPEPDYSRILYLAPTAAKLEEARRTMHGLFGGDGCYVPPRVATLGQISKGLASIYGGRVVLSKPLSPLIMLGLMEGHPLLGKHASMGFAKVTAGLVAELKLRFPKEGRGPGEYLDFLHKEVSAAFEGANAPEVVSARVTAALEIMGLYEEALEAAGAMDEEETLGVSPVHAHRLGARALIVDGIFELHESERGLFRELVASSDNTYIAVPYDDKYTEITDSYIKYIKDNFNVEESFLSPSVKAQVRTATAYPSIEGEVEGMARGIKARHLAGGGRELSDVLVALPSFGRVRRTVGRVFNKYGVPHGLRDPVTLLTLTPYLDLMRLLESLIEGYPRLRFAGFLSSRHFEKVPAELRARAPGVALSGGLVEGKNEWLNALDADERDALKEITDGFKSITDKDSYSGMKEALVDIAGGLGFTEPEADGEDGPRARAGELMDELGSVLSGISVVEELLSKAGGGRSEDKRGRKADLWGFIERMKHLLGSTSRDEGEPSGVSAMDFTATQGLEPRVLYLGGLRDGEVPAKPPMDLLLPEGVRTALGLREMTRRLRTEEFLFNRLVASAREAHLSYPSMDADKFYLPSTLLTDLGIQKTPRWPLGIFSKEEELVKQGGGPLTDHIKEINLGRAKGVGGVGGCVGRSERAPPSGLRT